MPRFCLSKGIGFACQNTWLLPVKKPPFYISKGRFFASQNGDILVYKMAVF
jgi:hypothetical protein